jgi:hypothetical protein
MAITRARTSSVAQGPSTRKTVLGGNDVILGGSYDAIGTVVVGSGGQSTVTFSSIPSTYKHLQIRGILRGTNASSEVSSRIRFNGDTASNYSYHGLYGNGSTANAEQIAPVNVMLFGSSPAASATSGIFGTTVIDILDYANTNKYKTVRALSGGDQNGAGGVYLTSNSWRNTNAITTIDIFASSGNLAQYTQFDLYGIK